MSSCAGAKLPLAAARSVAGMHLARVIVIIVDVYALLALRCVQSNLLSAIKMFRRLTVASIRANGELSQSTDSLGAAATCSVCFAAVPRAPSSRHLHGLALHPDKEEE